MRRLLAGAALAICVVAALPSRAVATYHTFKFDEVYSNPSGTIQFIELHETAGLNNQNLVTQAPDIRETSSSHIFNFPFNLPTTSTANKFILIATPGFAALPGAPAPDYIIPSNFFNPAGDTIQYGSTGPDGVVDLTTFGPLPTDGRLDLLRTGTTGNTWNSAVNTPTNFGGTTATIPEPASLSILLIASASLFCRRRRPVKI